MAETNKRKKTASTETSVATKPKSGKTSAKKPQTVSTTAASKKPAVSRTATAAAKKPSKKKGTPKGGDETQIEAKIRRKNTFAQQFLPYILVAIALFLAACFITNVIGDADTPDEHMMGAIGYPVADPAPRRVEDPLKWILWKHRLIGPYFTPRVAGNKPVFMSKKRWEETLAELEMANEYDCNKFYGDLQDNK